MLNDVIAVLILNELVGGGVKLLQDALRLLGSAVLENTLDDAATVGMRAQCEHLAGERAYDELQRSRLDAFDALLNDVIPVLILDALQDMPVQFAHDLLLLLRADRLQCLLYDSAAVHLKRQR